MRDRRINQIKATRGHFIQWLIVLFFFLCEGLPVYADESADALVLIQQGNKKEVFQGEKLSFYVKLLSPTWFSGSPRFDLPDIQGGMLYRVQSSPILGSEQVSGQSYTSQLHEFWFFPTKKGEITVPGISVSFSTAVPGGGESLHHQLQTAPFLVSVQSIPGAEGKTQLISTTRFDVQQSWEPEPADTITGSATTRIVRMRAADMASIFLPELSYPPLEGVAIYRRPPDVNDFNERGEATAERQESTTYVFEKEGTYTIPDINLTWWNSDAQKMEEITLPGAEVEISPGPPATGGVAKTQQPIGKQETSIPFILAILAGAFIVLAITFRYGFSLIKWIQQKKERYTQSEPAFFQAFRIACRTGDIVAAYNHLYFWIRKRSNKRILSIDQFLREHKQPQLDSEIETVEQHLFDVPKGDHPKWLGSNLLTQVTRARKKTTVSRPSTNRKPTYQELNF